MIRRLVLAHDLGTSSNKAVLMNADGARLATASSAYPTHSPSPRYAEQDPDDWWRAIIESTAAVMAEASARPDEVQGLTFTGQMQSTLPVDATGRPLMRAMIWLDTRAEQQAIEVTNGRIRVLGYGPARLLRWLWLTGGAPSLTGTDPICKIVWLRQNRPEIWSATRKLLDAKDYLLYRATGRFATAHDCANLTWLMDTRPGRRAWSAPLLEMIDLDEAMLPDLVAATEVVGSLTSAAAGDLGLRAGTPVIAGPGDVAAMAIGAGAVRNGVPHLALGTSSWIAAHSNRRAQDVFSYIGSMCSAHASRYLIVASQQNAGSAIEWLRHKVLDQDGAPASHEETARLVSACPAGASGSVFLPWLIGERTPIDDRHARGGFMNLDPRHGRAHMARAVFEGVAFNTRWALSKFEPLIAGRQEGLRLVGGGARGDLLPQIVADVLDRPLLRIAHPEFAAACGSALLALSVLGLGGDFDDLESLVPVERRFEPRPALRSIYDEGFAAFMDLYRRNRGWFSHRNRDRYSLE